MTKALTTGIVDQRSYEGSVEQVSGAAPADDQKHSHEEFNTVKNTIDQHAPLIDAACDLLERITAESGDTESLKNLRDDIESLTQLLASDDTDLDTAQERVDRIKQLIADVESIDIIDVSGLRDELDALALSIVKPDYDAAEADAAGILNKPDLTQSETYNVAKAAATGYVKGVSRILWNGYQYILNTDAVLQAARGNADTVDQTVLPSSGYGSDSSDWVKAGESLVVPFTVKNVAALLADTRAHSVFGNGQIIRTLEEGFSYLVDLQSSLTHDITTAGGVKLLALPGPSGWYNALSFGLIGLGADDTAVIANIASKMGISVVFPEGYVYNIHGSIACNDGQSFLSHGEFVIHENNYSYCFDVTGCKDVTFDGFLVNGQKSIFTYAENTSSDNALNSRTRYSFVFGVSCSNIEVVNCNFSEMYSAAVFLSGNLTAEEPDYTGVLLDRCSYLNGYFELAKIILMGDIVINQCFTSNSTNDFLSNSLLSNGVVTTACSDVRISGNYFGPCDGTGAKMESVNGAISVTGNHFELNDAQGLHLQESSVERGDVSSRREHVTVTGNTFDRPGNYGVYSGSVSASACRNINVVGNTFIACVEGCAYASGDNFTFSNNVSFGLPKTRGGADTNSCGVRIQQENSNEINNVSIVGNTFDMYNQNASGEAIVQMGAAGEVDFSIDTLVIANNIVSDFSFRGFWSNNELYCNNVLISGNVFSKAINDGTSSRDIFAFNSVHDLKWVVIGNIASQSIVVNLNSAGSKTTLLNNKVTASEGPDTANQYYVNGNGPKGSVYDLAGRSVQYLAGPPSSGEWRRGDIVWNDSPSAGDWAGWSCTSGGTPGVWMGFGAIEV